VPSVQAFVLAGGRGERLGVITKHRSKAAVPFGGRYRIIDFTLSNCVNSRVHTVYVAAQYAPRSLQEHLGLGRPWDLDRRDGGLCVLLPYTGRTDSFWYRGTADALYRNLDMLTARRAEMTLVLSGDQIYRMNYGEMIRQHRRNRSQVTIAVKPVTPADSSRFGIVNIDEHDRVTGFQEKPATTTGIPGTPGVALASMGIYIFRAEVLVRALEQDAAQPESEHDFGKNIIPLLIQTAPVYCYRFYDENKKAAKYWRDIGTLDAYYEASMDLCQVNPEFNLYDPEWPLRTYQPQAPPAKFVFAEQGRRCGQALDSVISTGCIVSGSRVIGSILCPNVRVHSFCEIEQTILMPGVRVGRHARIRRAIVDRDVLIPRGALIGFDPDEDRRRHTVTEGGVVIVTADDEPLIGPISEDALRAEAEADRSGPAQA